MAPPPALAYASAPATSPGSIEALVERAVDDMLQALENAQGDRIVLESNQIPLLLVGPRKCALMVGRLSAKAVRRIAEYILPEQYVEALDEIGGTCYRWPGFVALATYNSAELIIEIKRSRQATG